MKKLILLFALFFSLTGTASHFAGGDLQYVYIGGNTGVDHQYVFILRLYRDTSGIPMPNTVDVDICSSCYTTKTVSLPLGSVKFAPTLFDCVDPSSPGTVGMEVYAYVDTVILPGKCSDFLFATESLNARNGAVSNLNMASGNSNLVITATLNNYYGNNSSPTFVSEPVRAFCVGKKFNWKQSVVETDGDSIRFELIPPKGGGFGSTCSPLDYTFKTGWTYDEPIKTVPGTSLTLNAKTGVISFTPGFIEVDVLAVSVDEYRFDTVYYKWVKIGSSTRDMQITVSPTCLPLMQQGVVLDYDYPGIYPDSLSGLPTVDYTCLDSSITIHFSSKLDCSSISPDGTDFRLTSPNGQPIPIKEIIGDCDVNNDAVSVEIKLHKPLALNGDYYLYSKSGNDGNTLVNKCGFAMNEFDTIQLRVSGCFKLMMDLTNVTVENDQNTKVEWELDPNSYPNYLFNKISVFRKKAANLFVHIGDVYDPTKTHFIDSELTSTDVDAQSYEYKIEMILNDEQMGKTRAVHSILLEGTGNSCDTLALNWNHYNGWPGANYLVEVRRPDGNGGYEWIQHQGNAGQVNPTTEDHYLFISNYPQGDYKVRVRTEDPSGRFESMSNWVDCGKTSPAYPDPEAVIVPNVMTPNGDGVNDALLIAKIEGFRNRRHVSVYNRWGQIVYNNEMYDNSKPFHGEFEGKLLVDGVYFITLDLYDEASGSRFKANTSITLMSSLAN